MPNKITNSKPQRAMTHPLARCKIPAEPTVLNGKKVAPKVRLKPTYSHTLNNYEAIRNLVTLNSDTAPDAVPAEMKRVHIKV